MKFWFFIFSTLVSLSFAHAQMGGVVGGGGNGVVCRNGSEIISVELLDLYESRILYGRDYDSMEHLTLDEALEWASTKLYSYDFKPAESNYYFFKGIYSGFRFLPPGVRLDPINDSGHIFIPAGCKIEQVANFYSNDKVFVVSDFYEKMDNLNRAALVVHEALWWKDRLMKVETSRYARRLVGAIFDRDFVFENPSLGANPAKKLLCTTPTGKKSELFNYEFNPGLKKITSFEVIKDGAYYRLQFLTLNGHQIYSHKFFYIGDEINFQWLEKGRASEVGWSSASTLSSKFDSGEMFIFSYEQKNAAQTIHPKLKGYRVNQIKATWKGSDPDDSFEDLEFVCTEVEFGEIPPYEQTTR
jgi:hypothetical protein